MVQESKTCSIKLAGKIKGSVEKNYHMQTNSLRKSDGFIEPSNLLWNWRKGSALDLRRKVYCYHYAGAVSSEITWLSTAV